MAATCKLLLSDFKDDFEFYRHSEREARNPDQEPNGDFLDAKYISKEVRHGIPYPGLVKEVSMSCHEQAETDNACDSIERAQMLFGSSEGAQSSSVCRVPSRLDIKFFPEPAKILRLMIDNREHAAQKEQVACLHRFDVVAKRSGCRRELNTKVL